jgi:hypothetical protein
MITGFSKIIIAVPDLAVATQEYRWLLGDSEVGAKSLRNVEICLNEASAAAVPRIAALGLLDDGVIPATEPDSSRATRGLELEIHRERRVNPSATTSTGIIAVDHLVLQTGDADACIRLFGEEGLGLRLALDQSVPEWGGRMLFFRCGKMTLEVIHNLEDPPQQDFFWGITYLCENLESTLLYLDKAGVDHSPARTGRKPGSSVATVKSHNLGIPTLLIEHAV